MNYTMKLYRYVYKINHKCNTSLITLKNDSANKRGTQGMAQTSCKSLMYLIRSQISFTLEMGHATVPPSARYLTLLSSRHLRCRNRRAFKSDETCGETLLKALGCTRRAALIGSRNLKVDTDRGPHTSQHVLLERVNTSSLPNFVNNVFLLHVLLLSATTLRRALSLHDLWSDLFVYTREKEVHPFLPALPLSYS